MLLQRLKGPVVVTGKTFLGRPCSITIKPNDDPNDHYINWQTHEGAAPLRVSPQVARLKKRKVQLVNGNAVLDIIEHILPCRFLWPGFTIVGTSMPYFGRGLEFFEAMMEKSEPCAYPKIPLYAVQSRVKYEYEKARAGLHLGITLITHYNYNAGGLHVRVKGHYTGLKEAVVEGLEFPSVENLRHVLTAKTIGGYEAGGALYTFSRLNSWWWPHMDKVDWVQHVKPGDIERASENAALHGAQDLLGLLALLCLDGMFTGTVNRSYSGHAGDFHAMQSAAKCLRRV